VGQRRQGRLDPSYRITATILCLFLLAPRALAQKPRPVEPEDEYYRILRFEVPPGEVLEAGAIEIMPDGRVAIGTRRGEVWFIDNAYAADPKQAGVAQPRRQLTARQPQPVFPVLRHPPRRG